MISFIGLLDWTATIFVWGVGIFVVLALVMKALDAIIYAPQTYAAKPVLHMPMPWERYVWWGISAAVGILVAAFVLIAVVG